MSFASSAKERLSGIASQLVSPNAGKGKAALLAQNPNDVVIVAACRTPITRARKGGLKDTCQEELLKVVFEDVVKRAGIDKNLVEEIQVGNVLPPGGGATVARMAQLAAGFPTSSSVATVNRQCSSGLVAVNHIALMIADGQIDIGIGAGVESMTQNYGAGVMPEKMSEVVLANQQAADCLIPMGITSENVAAKYNVSREKQDAFAAESQQRAFRAQTSGKFKDEITPVRTKWVDPKTEEEKDVVIDQDDGIRDGVTKESLSKLKPAFSKTGSTHAGNASQVSDGAAAVLLTRRSKAQELGLPILGKFAMASIVGVEPNLMGIGPAFAIPKVLARAGISKDDVDLYELNEAFASQAVMSIEHIGLDTKKVNPNGGAIALGHPLGCTGARQIATALSEAKRTGARIICTSMCIGSGMGAASLIVAEN
ncbi:hypothetical protein JCM10908_005771 [Rhodotorula pacifica]|uniref:uncharacterized protein n=1 Tax=Rhodotorula pacifica TaxID=1495444 RepID=UPI003170D3EA